MSHPDEGLIHAWLDGELDAAETARVEALVASDAEWAAAAAEARGLIAASARIVGALDRVPANVIPKAPPAPAASRRWVWRAAAALALMAGSAVVLERESPVLPAPKLEVAASGTTPQPADSTAGAAGAPGARQLPREQMPQPPAVARDAKVAAGKKNAGSTRELADAKPAEPALDKDAVAPQAQLQGRASGGVTGADANGARAERRAVNAPMAATVQAAAPLPPQPASPTAAAAPTAQNFAPERLTRLQPSCFSQREPADSAARIIRLSAAALDDSIRLETLVLRGDTLAAVHGRFTAVRVRCPQP
ncbi:MAG: anti-sigma factor family protein [Gemmatimonadales bacterium]